MKNNNDNFAAPVDSPLSTFAPDLRNAGKKQIWSRALGGVVVLQMILLASASYQSAHAGFGFIAPVEQNQVNTIPAVPAVPAVPVTAVPLADGVTVENVSIAPVENAVGSSAVPRTPVDFSFSSDAALTDQSLKNQTMQTLKGSSAPVNATPRLGGVQVDPNAAYNPATDAVAQLPKAENIMKPGMQHSAAEAESSVIIDAPNDAVSVAPVTDEAASSIFGIRLPKMSVPIFAPVGKDQVPQASDSPYKPRGARGKEEAAARLNLNQQVAGPEVGAQEIVPVNMVPNAPVHDIVIEENIAEPNAHNVNNARAVNAPISIEPLNDGIVPFSMVDGFGRDIPLSLAIKQIVPADYTVQITHGINMGARLTWQDGQPWNVALQKALYPHNLEIIVHQNVVVIREAHDATSSMNIAPLAPEKSSQVVQAQGTEIIPVIQSDVMPIYAPSAPSQINDSFEQSKIVPNKNIISSEESEKQVIALQNDGAQQRAFVELAEADIAEIKNEQERIVQAKAEQNIVAVEDIAPAAGYANEGTNNSMISSGNNIYAVGQEQSYPRRDRLTARDALLKQYAAALKVQQDNQVVSQDDQIIESQDLESEVGAGELSSVNVDDKNFIAQQVPVNLSSSKAENEIVSNLYSKSTYKNSASNANAPVAQDIINDVSGLQIDEAKEMENLNKAAQSFEASSEVVSDAQAGGKNIFHKFVDKVSSGFTAPQETVAVNQVQREVANENVNSNVSERKQYDQLTHIEKESARTLNVTEIYYFTAQAGSSLQDVMKSWSQQAGVELFWEKGQDYTLPQDIKMHGSYQAALKTLLQTYDKNNEQPKGQLYPNAPHGPAVLVIQHDSANS
jgi:hypothetical protein